MISLTSAPGGSCRVRSSEPSKARLMRGMSSLYPYTRPSAGHGSTNSPEAEGRPEVPARKKVSGPSPSYVNPYSVDRIFLRLFML